MVNTDKLCSDGGLVVIFEVSVAPAKTDSYLTISISRTAHQVRGPV